jgi:N-hydroxyarylamine O-acetyltransferase
VLEADLQAYLRRIGMTPPTAADRSVLDRMISAHISAIPFEAIDALLGREIKVEPAALAEKLVHQRRGGWCFEQSSLFIAVLRSLGFDARPHLSSVLWGRPLDAPRPVFSHMAVVVRLEHDDWLVDVGFGSCVTPRALRMSTDEPQPTAHETFRLSPVDGLLRLEAMIDGDWKRIYDLSLDPVGEDDIRRLNGQLVRCGSLFHELLLVTRTIQSERLLLVGHEFRRRRNGRTVESTPIDAARISHLLSLQFGLTLGSHDAGALTDKLQERGKRALPI